MTEKGTWETGAVYAGHSTPKGPGTGFSLANGGYYSVDLGGHGYGLVTVTADWLETEFV